MPAALGLLAIAAVAPCLLPFAGPPVGWILDAFLVSRGVKTLAVRMQSHDRNALAVARYLEAHAAVAEVLHPGLESHPQHELAVRQASGSGGTFSFRVRGGATAALALLGAVRLFTLAESLGGVESLIEHPATMTHAAMPADVRRGVGITDDLIRISVGLEHVDDLIADLEQALASTQGAVTTGVAGR